MNRRAWRAAVHGIARVRHDLAPFLSHGSIGKESACNAGDLGSIPGLGRCPGEGNSNPLRYSWQENPMDRRAWWAMIHGVARVRHDLVTKPPPATLNTHRMGCCWSSSFRTLATWCKELTHCKRNWWWKRLKAKGEGGGRGWDGYITSPTQWTWIWANSKR